MYPEIVILPEPGVWNYRIHGKYFDVVLISFSKQIVRIRISHICENIKPLLPVEARQICLPVQHFADLSEKPVE